MADGKLNKKLFFLPAIGVSLLLSALFTHYYGNYEIKSNVVKVNEINNF